MLIEVVLVGCSPAPFEPCVTTHLFLHGEKPRNDSMAPLAFWISQLGYSPCWMRAKSGVMVYQVPPRGRLEYR